MKEKKKAYLLAIIVVLFWSTVPSAFKLSLRYLNEMELLLYSSFFAVLALFIILLVQKKLSMAKGLKKQDYLLSALLGLLNPFLYYLVVFKAYSLLPAQMAQPLNMIWGIVIVFVAIPFLKQKVKIKDIVALLICFLGVVVISIEGDFSRFHVKNPLGVILAVGSSLVWSFYFILNVKDKLDATVRLFMNFMFGFLFILVFAAFFVSFKIPPLEGLGGAFWVGLFEMALAYTLWIMALKLSDATVDISILIYIVPFISFIFINVVVGEVIKGASVAGALLIVVGILLNKYSKKGKPKKRKLDA